MEALFLYEWDWDGDGTFDISTTSPVITKTWSEQFTGNIMLKVTDNEGSTNIDSTSVDIEPAISVITVDIDIKPGSYPNCFNVNGHGVIPVAVLGSDTFDVTQIDINTLNFAGLDVRVKGNSSPQCSVEDVSGDFTDPAGAPDGYDDLVCQFVDDPSVWSPGDGIASLIGALYDETAIEGSDAICIVP